MEDNLQSCCSMRSRFQGMLTLPRAVLTPWRLGSSRVLLPQPWASGMSSYSLATLLQSTSCQPHTLITGSHGVQKKSMFCELGQLGSRVTQGPQGSPKELLGSPDSELGTQWRAYVTIPGSSNLKGQRSTGASVTPRANTVCHFPGT